MAKSKQKSGNRASAAKTPARSKPAARAATAVARKAAAKPVAKKASAPAKKAAKKPVPAKTPVKKAAAKTPVKAAAPKTPAKKAVPAKKVVPAKPVKKAAKPVPAKPAKPPVSKVVVQKKTVIAAPSKVKSSTGSATEQARKFVTTSKPETSAAPKSAKSRGAASPPIENGVTMQDGRYALPTTISIELPHGYKPSAKEEYMSPRQLQYFRSKLSKWREELVEESRQTIESLRDEVRDVGDEAERATRETENSLELRTRDRYRKLIAKIDKALKRIEEGRYGFCEETDEEIGIDRLEARPIATLSLDAQERWEHRQKQMGD